MELSFGLWLKKRRRALDLTQQDLAARAYCSVNTIRKIEADALVPSKALALELARALNVPAHAEFVRFARTPDATVSENTFTETPPRIADAAEQHAPEIRFHAPAPLNAVFGRDHDIGVLDRMLQLPATRLVTLTGPPGTGKTRLALEVAAQVQDRFEHGAAFVALAPLTQAAQIESAVANLLGVRETDATTLAAALRAFLREKELLLVLDNVEHLLVPLQDTVRTAAAFVTEWLSRAPRLKVLATSREPLRVHGEREVTVSPLTIPPFDPPMSTRQLEKYPAVQLFVERAQEVNLGFELNAANAAAVARVCVELEGLPLAIEMAAARVKWEPPQQLLPHLSRRLEALSSGRRDHDARQQTLRGALDWSYALLNESEQPVFRQLGVFRGSFSLEAAVAVCELPTSTLLDNLVEKSLVKAERDTDGERRYALLEFIREYACEQLGAKGDGDSVTAGEGEAAQARHYTFFVQLAERAEVHMNDNLQNVWMGRLERDYDNLRAALEWAESQPDANLMLRLTGALHFFWKDRRDVSEAQEWYARALTKSDAQSAPHYLAKTYSGAGSIAWMHGNLNQAYMFHERALEYFERVRDNGGIAFSLHNLAVQKLGLGETDTAKQLALRALEIARQENILWLTSYVCNELGVLASAQGDQDQADAYYQESLALARENQDHFHVSLLLHNLGCGASRRCDFERAAALFEDVFQLAHERRYQRVIAATLGEQGLMHIRQGQPAQAVSVCQRGARLAYEASFQDILAFNLEWLAAARAYLFECAPAARLWGFIHNLRQEIAAPLGVEYQSDSAQAIAFARAQLGDESFDRLFMQGQQMNALELVRERNGIYV